MLDFTTSGTTGKAKAFSLSEENLAKRIERDRHILGPVYASLKSIYVGCSPGSTSAARYRTRAEQAGVKFYTDSGLPWDMVARFADERIEGIVDLPDFLSAYAEMNGATGHRFKFARGTGSKCTASMSKRIREGLCPTPIFTYGASEIGTIAIATPDMVESIDGCAGKVCDDIELEIANGEVRVRGATLIDGYADPALTAKKFRDGWFYPGDRAEWCDGLLVLKGRTSR